MKKVYYRKRKNKTSRVLITIFSILLTIIIVTAFTMILFDPDPAGRQPQSSMEDQSSSMPEDVSSSSEPTSMVPPEDSSSEEESSMEESVSGDSSEESSGGQIPAFEPTKPLPECDPVGDVYFDNTIFIGDSITEGLALYRYVDFDRVIAYRGINPDNVRTKKWITINGTDYTVAEALAMKDPAHVKRVYIMMGTNGVAWITPEKLVEFMDEFIAQVQAVQPQATVFLLSIPPVDPAHYQSHQITNEAVNEYNRQLSEYAAEKGFPFVNVHESLVDENGGLDPSVSAQDGTHFSGEGYDRFVQYLRTHALPLPGEEAEASQPETSVPTGVVTDPGDEDDPAQSGTPSEPSSGEESLTESDPGDGDDPAQSSAPSESSSGEESLTESDPGDGDDPAQSSAPSEPSSGEESLTESDPGDGDDPAQSGTPSEPSSGEESLTESDPGDEDDPAQSSAPSESSSEEESLTESDPGDGDDPAQSSAPSELSSEEESLPQEESSEIADDDWWQNMQDWIFGET